MAAIDAAVRAVSPQRLQSAQTAPMSNHTSPSPQAVLDDPGPPVSPAEPNPWLLPWPEDGRMPAFLRGRAIR